MVGREQTEVARPAESFSSFPAPEDLLDLIDILRCQFGYNIGVEQYIAAQDLLLALTTEGQLPCHPRRLCTWLAPLLCSSPAEQ
jgi:hypothetical protein